MTDTPLLDRVSGPADMKALTDADLALGYLNADNFLGGEMKLRRDLSEAALGKLAAKLSVISASRMQKGRSSRSGPAYRRSFVIMSEPYLSTVTVSRIYSYFVTLF